MRHVGLPSRRQEVEEKESPVFAAVAKRHETKVARPLVRQVDRSLDEEIREKQRPSYRADPEPAVEEEEEEEEEEDKQEYVERAPRTPAAARRTERSTEAEYMRSTRYQPRAVQKEDDEDHFEEGDGFAKPAAKTPAKARRSEPPAERLSGQEFGHGSQYRLRTAQNEEDEDFDEYVDERRYKPKPTLKASLSPSKVPRRLSDFDSEPVPAPETAPPPAPPPPLLCDRLSSVRLCRNVQPPDLQPLVLISLQSHRLAAQCSPEVSSCRRRRFRLPRSWYPLSSGRHCLLRSPMPPRRSRRRPAEHQSRKGRVELVRRRWVAVFCRAR
ncbi:hypothetical protein DL89DRAFT_20885 [Linderina pennispora]|uniref:Uncharacterized protein n=1 Tax=Linderina pennispora TaxID=61395 RepID=A0A1Y1WNI0_9FUNG|nr:uncharacterized protein DL89DRAFT_20885 [Linderina pennispora]ORX74664.1 hypothetical protein DL89DRAFT_20885 [Linderina pennispora]